MDCEADIDKTICVKRKGTFYARLFAHKIESRLRKKSERGNKLKLQLKVFENIKN